jgi:galactosylxylosylprotein 3-beta-galactosyltransferase
MRLRSRLLSDVIRFGIVFLLGVLVGVFYPHEQHDAPKPIVQLTPRNFVANPLENFITILIVSAPFNNEARQVLRETWLSDCHRPFCVVKFAIGTKSVDIGQIKDIRNNDILPLAELKDAYSSLTKKVALSMKWIANNLNSKFVLKADEDTFVNLVELVKELNKYDTDLYMGYFTGRARVKKSGPWAEPNWLLCDYYLPNARGGGYVLGKGNVQFIAENADRLTIWNSEDVSVGAWLGPVRAKRVHSVRFDTESKSRGCHNSYIITHKQTADDLREKWHFLKKTGDICYEETQISSGYRYNWTVSPSQCCVPDKSIP